MIDTMTVFWEITKSEYGVIDEAFKKISFFDKNKDKNARITHYYHKCGFPEIRLRNNQMYNYRALEITLRPKLLVEAGNYNDVTHLHEFIKVRENFNSILSEIMGMCVPDFFQWKVKRIDYAIDLKVDEDLIPKYMFMIKKGNLADYMLNPKALEYFGEENNVYIRCESFTINWYDRYLTQCTKQDKTKKSYNNLEDLRGTFRFEIGMMDARKVLRGRENKVLNFLNLTICEERILFFYDLIVGSGDFVTHTEGVKIIEGIEQQSKRMKLRRIYNLINQLGCVWQAREEYKEKASDSKRAAGKFSKSLNQIRELGVNPLSLPSEWGVRLPNIRDQIVGYFVQYQEKYMQISNKLDKQGTSSIKDEVS